MKKYRYPNSYRRLTDSQRAVFDQLVACYETSTHCFLTGNAGTGKSFVANCFSDFCMLNRIALAKCAPTGVAATAINGTTMHKLFKLPLSIVPDRPDSRQYQNIYKTLAFADVIFIDEISMARVDVLDGALRQVWKASEIRRNTGKKPIQVVVCGDFGQLAPVVTPKDREAYEEIMGYPIGKGYCYAGGGWKYMDFKPLVLTEPMRQADKEFCAALDAIKTGDARVMEYLNANTSPDPVADGVWICGYNKSVMAINHQRLDELPDELHIRKARISGEADIAKTNLEPELHYKKGARVMMLTNEPHGRWCNGSLGVIREISGDRVTIRMDTGFVADVFPYNLEFLEYEVDGGTLVQHCVGSIVQYPFKLGYAVTVHKSQGQTYDAVNLVPEMFAPGQLYVALSRCRSAGKLYIQPDREGNRLQPRHLIADEATSEFIRKTFAAPAAS